jgi:hypothetical protein
MFDSDRTGNVRRRAVANSSEAVGPILASSGSMQSNARNLHQFGWIVSGAYILAFVVYAVVCHHAFYVMTPEQFATTLSGAFAPLAFLWLVLGFMQQGEELRHSAEALRLQSEELRNSVEQ